MAFHHAPVEDCRDFLRTGRCKYGMSCKYNHPPNVLNGGGIKPSDPTEQLLFPIRPDEQVCDYYMKHRTCKFGSACKFNHPPLTSASGMYSNGSGMMFMSPPPPPSQHQRRSEPVQLLLSPVGGTELGANGQAMMMQYLPQRPGEPDCIYFLKNRSCKYGATCRYHHPVLSRQRLLPDNSTRPKQRQLQQQHDAFTSSDRGGQRVQYVTQLMPSYNQQHHQGQVLLAPESSSSAPVTVITVDGSMAQGYLVSTSSIDNSGPAYCIPAGSVGFTEQSSSASSVGSSLETATNGEFVVQGDNAVSRIRRNTSVGSFNSEVHRQQQQQQQQQGVSYLPHSMSEGNIAHQQQRRTRATSFGSATDGAGHRYESNGQLSWSQRARGASFGSRQDQGPLLQQQQQQQQQQYPHYGSNLQQQQQLQHRHRSTGNLPGRARPNHGPDEGFTRMTSVLLNMLDTPEEAECVSDSEETPSYNRGRSLRAGDVSAVSSDMLARLHLAPNHHDVPQEIIRTETLHHDADLVGDHHDRHSAFLRSLSDGRDVETTKGNIRNGPALTATSWFPTWTGSNGAGEEVGDFFSMLHQPQNSKQSQNGHESDIGMYLP